jgi:hypothetical protein
MTPKRAVKETARDWLRRLNVLLRFARVDMRKLDDRAFRKLQDEMYFAVDRDPGPPENQVTRTMFDARATREAFSEAQPELARALQRLLVDLTKLGPLAQFELARFKLAGEELSIGVIKGAFDFRSHTNHFPSQVYKAFRDALKASGVKPTDFLHCSHCDTVFVPLRKPRKGTPVYCSAKCSTVVGSRNYRARQAAAGAKKKKVAEKRIREAKKTG